MKRRLLFAAGVAASLTFSGAVAESASAACSLDARTPFVHTTPENARQMRGVGKLTCGRNWDRMFISVSMRHILPDGQSVNSRNFTRTFSNASSGQVTVAYVISPHPQFWAYRTRVMSAWVCDFVDPERTRCVIQQQWGLTLSNWRNAQFTAVGGAFAP